MQQPYVSTLIEQDFTSAEKALGRHNIDAISSADLEGYATQEWVQDQNYITSADLPDVSDMATKTWTNENFYPDTNPSGFITSSDVPRYREGDYISIDPISLAISVTGINPDDYLTSADLVDYATHEEVESATSGKMDSSEASAFYPRYENPEGYITSADLPDLSDYVTSADVSGFVDVNYVENNFYSASNPSGFVTSADLPDLSDYATKTYVDENFYSASNPSGFITSADLPDLSEYATIQYVDNSINSATSGKQDSLVFGYTDNKISSINNSAIYSSGGGSFTQEQSDWAEEDNTQVDYIKNKPTPVALEAISPLYITDETSASKIGIYSSAFPDMTDYATKEYVDSATSGKQDSLTFGYTDNKISSINSSAIYSTGGGGGSDIYRKTYGGSEIAVSALKIDSDDPDGYAYVTADDVGQGYLVQGPYKKLLDAGINSEHGVGDSATPIYIDIDGTFKTVSATFTQEQSDWAEDDNTQVDYIKNKPTPVGLKAGSGITLTDETSAVMISSNVPYPTVECQAISVEYSGYVKVVYPQSSACCELHVTTPYRYGAVAEYSAKINDDMTWAIPSGCWYDFIKQDFDGTVQWCFKDSGNYYA